MKTIESLPARENNADHREAYVAPTLERLGRVSTLTQAIQSNHKNVNDALNLLSVGAI
jgi:hypothetical protein